MRAIASDQPGGTHKSSGASRPDVIYASPVEPPPVPGKVVAIGALHLACGLMDIMLGMIWLGQGLFLGAATLGLGLVLCLPGLVLLPLGTVELVSGLRHIDRRPRPLSAPKWIGAMQLSAILGFGIFSFISGILTLVFLQDPAVANHYAQRRALHTGAAP